jgi:glycosyltransferase involved in cell wall biosynthesis
MIEYPLTSIIIPCYNYGELIQETLASLLAQSYRNWEAIVIDDGSTDDTAENVLKLSEKDSRIKYFYQSNQGVSEARNYGLRQARGEFIQFLDADDILSSRKIEKQATLLINKPFIDICYTQTYYFKHPDRDLLYGSFQLKPDEYTPPPSLEGKGFEAISELINKNLMICTPLIRAHVLKSVPGFQKEVSYAEDHEFWIRCALVGSHFSFLDDPDAYSVIRVHSASASQNKTALVIGESQLRKRLPELISAAAIDGNEKLKLIEQNEKLQMDLQRLILSQTTFGNGKLLRYVYGNTGSLRFMLYMVKELNRRRKNLFL